jgi:hypothetical protein
MPGELTRFQAGRSGNPAGRPKDHGVVAAVRKRYGQTGARLIEALHVLAFEGPDARHKFFGESVKVTTTDRRECLEVLLERGYGKVVPDLPAARGEWPSLTVNIVGISRPPKLANAPQALPAIAVTASEGTDKQSEEHPCGTHRT